MSPEEIKALKYTELRNLAKAVGIKANLKAEKLRSALNEYYSKAEQSPGATSAESEETQVRKSKTPATGTPIGKHTPRVGKQVDSGRKATPQIHKTPQANSAAKRKSSTGKKSVDVAAKRKRTQSSDNQDATFTKRHKRSDTYEVEGGEGVEQVTAEGADGDNSPGVKEVVDSLTGDMTSEQMKTTLMHAIDKRAKAKVEKNAPVPDVSDTQIPRFTALGAIRTYSSKKPITPGNRDWEKIHQREFDKMQSLDTYLVNKKQRSETLTQSMKKMRLLTQQMRFAVDSVKQYKTPPSLLKGRANIIKPAPKAVGSSQNRSKALFQTPAAKPFVPTVTSTSKANFNFATMSKSTHTKSPAAKTTPSTKPSLDKTQKSKITSKTPVAKTTVTVKVSNTPKQRTSAMSTPANRLNSEPVRKSPRLSGISSPLPDDDSPTISFKPSTIKGSTKENRKSAGVSAKKFSVTPFRFNSTLNKSNLNASHNSSVNKPKFDLKASLARPMTWKRHTGKLQPLKIDNIYAQPLNAKQTTVAARAAMKKDNRRKLEQRARADRRLDEQMRRRGIVA